jgi:transposase-like protein
MRKERKHYTPEEKVAIMRRHLLDKVPISDLCEELALQPTVFYRWQKEFFEHGAGACQGHRRPNPPNNNGSSFWKRRSRPKTKSWLN